MTGHPLTEHCLAEVRESTVVHKSVDELRAKEANDNVSFPSTGNGAGSTPETDLESTPASKETSGAAPNDTEGDGEGEGEEDDEEEEGGTDDQMLKNCRAAHDSDGLLSFAEIVQLHDLSRPAPGQKSSPFPSPSASDSSLVGQRIGCALTSAYGSAHNRLEPSQDGNYFGSAGRGRERHDDAEWKPDTPNIHLGPSVECVGVIVPCRVVHLFLLLKFVAPPLPSLPFFPLQTDVHTLLVAFRPHSRLHLFVPIIRCHGDDPLRCSRWPIDV